MSRKNEQTFCRFCEKREPLRIPTQQERTCYPRPPMKEGNRGPSRTLRSGKGPFDSPCRKFSGGEPSPNPRDFPPTLLLEKSRQAQFLKPMAISISYGIMIATFLTLLMLPLLLSINNSLTVRIKWLITGRMASKEEVTRAVKELKLEENENK